eukprot:CAMPEP_0170485712 /NCGR_PEP_ID=MMETSP0208-20121228/4906_1 /TAXON_ID=197538 /ORGANISM="Strombidium inclinatum, Strain S3" /LENGTH=95 /DNA_ID=CAMNT_0010759433 /DNA_START=485 /DNA_END=768 /DNA_ORIENTATION=+
MTQVSPPELKLKSKSLQEPKDKKKKAEEQKVDLAFVNRNKEEVEMKKLEEHFEDLFKPDQIPDKSCFLCFEPLNKEGKLVVGMGKCGHILHKDCA